MLPKTLDEMYSRRGRKRLVTSEPSPPILRLVSHTGVGRKNNRQQVTKGLTRAAGVCCAVLLYSRERNFGVGRYLLGRVLTRKLPLLAAPTNDDYVGLSLAALGKLAKHHTLWDKYVDRGVMAETAKSS